MQLSSNHHIEDLVHGHGLEIRRASMKPQVAAPSNLEPSDDLPDPFYFDVCIRDLVPIDSFKPLDEVQHYLDESQLLEECLHCELAPCIWIFNKAQMVEYTPEVVLLWLIPVIRLSSKRKALYWQIMPHISNGHLGRGNHKPHTECVKQGIHDIFPDPNGQFMGHHDA